MITLKKKNKQKKQREHNHFPMGKSGYVPRSAGQNPYSSNFKKV